MAEKSSFVWMLFNRLRRRRFSIGIDDYQTLKQAMLAGFGLHSRLAFCQLICALWAKSVDEQTILTEIFDQLAEVMLPDWQLSQLSFKESSEVAQQNKEINTQTSINQQHQQTSFEQNQQPEQIVNKIDEEQHSPVTVKKPGLPEIPLNISLPPRPFIFVPQFPVTSRETVQAWRRLRRPLRKGPKTEIDIEATLTSRLRMGIVSPVVLVPRRRNSARICLLVDRQGSMAPFHRFTDEVCKAILQSCRFENAKLYYFHDTPAEGADERVLTILAEKLVPTLDLVIKEITPFTEGSIFLDPELSHPTNLVPMLEKDAVASNIVVISDGGAARGQYDLVRLLDTIAVFKTIRIYTKSYVWLNPMPRRYWQNSTAAQIARHIHMFPLDRDGIFHAVNVLRGQIYELERPL